MIIMTRYLIRPQGLRQHSFAWAPTLRRARETKALLQNITGIKWRIKKHKFVYDAF